MSAEKDRRERRRVGVVCRVFVHENLGRGVSRRVGIWQETREDEVVPDRYLHLHQGVIVHRLTLFLSSNPLAILLTPQLGLLSHPADFILATLWPPSWPLNFFLKIKVGFLGT